MTTCDLDEKISDISNDFWDGNLNIALDKFKEITDPLHAAYAVGIMIYDEMVSEEDIRWLLNAIYNGSKK